MRLLGYIWVGAHCISVFEKEQPKVDGEDVDGSFAAQDHIIAIKAGMPVSRQREVLVHEMMHLAYYHTQLDEGNKRHSEETVCTRLGPSIAEMLNRNTWLSKYLEDGRS